MLSVRRMDNLRKARSEINRRPVGVDRIHYQGFIHPREYARWNPDMLRFFPDLEPMKDLQGRIAYGDFPDVTQEVRVKGRSVERGTVANRIIERAITRKLVQNLDPFFANASWGYRPRRSPEKAIKEVQQLVRGGAHWALKTDVRKFFTNVDRNILTVQLLQSIPDEFLCNFIMSSISPVLIFRNGGGVFPRTGLPEGNGLTPFLSNLYLHRLDLACSRFSYIRYADDILILGHTRQEVLRAKKFITRLIGQLRLELNPRKTAIQDLYLEPVVFLGYEIRGGNLYPPHTATVRLEKKLRIRGLEHRKELMCSFVRRYAVGPVRKLFRRLDRRLKPLYPVGSTLTGLLDALRAE